MGCIGCIPGLILLPVRFIRYIFTNGTKGYIVGAITMVIIFIIALLIAVSKPLDPKPHIIPAPPTAITAPYEIDTNSRIYFAKTAEKDEDGIVTMTDYWELLNYEWIYTEGSFTFEENFGTVIIIERS